MKRAMSEGLLMAQLLWEKRDNEHVDAALASVMFFAFIFMLLLVAAAYTGTP